MTRPPAPGRLEGWGVLAAAFVIIAMSIGTLFTLGVFLRPIEDDMGWGRSAIGAIGLLNWIVMGLGSFAWGYLSDRFGTRLVVLAGGVLLGLGLVLSGQVTAIWQLYLSFGVVVAAGVSAFYVPLTVNSLRWFEGRRGLAAAIVSAGNGFGILVLSPLSRWLINELDWRWAFVILGDLAWLIVIPCGLLIRDPGDRQPAAPGPERTPGRAGASFDARPMAIFRSGPLWSIALTHFACCAAHSGPIFHIVSHAMDLGVAKMAAATLLGASGLSSIFGRVATGMVADRIGAKPTLLAALALQAAMIASYLVAADLGMLYGVGVVFGVAYGGAMPLYALITQEYFGDRGMGTAFGAVFFVSCIGMGLGSFAGGVIHDAVGSYRWLFLASFAVGAAGVVLGATLHPPRPTPARATRQSCC